MPGLMKIFTILGLLCQLAAADCSSSTATCAAEQDNSDETSLVQVKKAVKFGSEREEQQPIDDLALAQDSFPGGFAPPDAPGPYDMQNIQEEISKQVMNKLAQANSAKDFAAQSAAEANALASRLHGGLAPRISAFAGAQAQGDEDLSSFASQAAAQEELARNNYQRHKETEMHDLAQWKSAQDANAKALEDAKKNQEQSYYQKFQNAGRAAEAAYHSQKAAELAAQNGAKKQEEQQYFVKQNAAKQAAEQAYQARKFAELTATNQHHAAQQVEEQQYQSKKAAELMAHSQHRAAQQVAEQQYQAKKAAELMATSAAKGQKDASMQAYDQQKSQEFFATQTKKAEEQRAFAMQHEAKKAEEIHQAAAKHYADQRAMGMAAPGMGAAGMAATGGYAPDMAAGMSAGSLANMAADHYAAGAYPGQMPVGMDWPPSNRYPVL